jgi:multiple sugar transport system substrate-binding protein
VLIDHFWPEDLRHDERGRPDQAGLVSEPGPDELKRLGRRRERALVDALTDAGEQFGLDIGQVSPHGNDPGVEQIDRVGKNLAEFPLLLEQGTSYCNLTAANAAPMFQTVADWTKAGYLPKEAATWTQTDTWTQFMSGKYAFLIDGNWNLGAAQAATFSWGTTQYPAGADGSLVFPGGEAMGISAFTKYPQAAWEYLQTWLSSQGSVIDFQNSGQIPTRADAATAPAVKDDTAAAPFVAAIKTVSAWPTSSKIAQMQVSVGTELSDVVSGQASAASAAAATATAIQGDIKAGGGVC